MNITCTLNVESNENIDSGTMAELYWKHVQLYQNS